MNLETLKEPFVIILSGPPMSGKSTWVKANFPDTEVISRDDVDGLFIKNEDFLIPGKLSNGVWDEGKSGVNPFEYNYLYIWYTGSSSVMGFLIEKHAVNRDIEVRDVLINKILE